MREEGVLRADGGAGPAPQPVPGTGAENSGLPAGVNLPPMPGDDRLATRMARAERYLDNHLKKQRQWYSEKASAHKDWSQRLNLAVIACGALVTVAQVFASALPWLSPL
jgi:crotonobetainyl-CoA:carnitine CoA-transferase CaiB-like acyl-CoA transferase